MKAAQPTAVGPACSTSGIAGQVVVASRPRLRGPFPFRAQHRAGVTPVNAAAQASAGPRQRALAIAAGPSTAAPPPSPPAPGGTTYGRVAPPLRGSPSFAGQTPGGSARWCQCGSGDWPGPGSFRCSGRVPRSCATRCVGRPPPAAFHSMLWLLSRSGLAQAPGASISHYETAVAVGRVAWWRRSGRIRRCHVGVCCATGVGGLRERAFRGRSL